MDSICVDYLVKEGIIYRLEGVDSGWGVNLSLLNDLLIRRVDIPYRRAVKKEDLIGLLNLMRKKVGKVK